MKVMKSLTVVARMSLMPAADARQFIEDFALALTNSGMQRMASRAFAALLVSERGSLTARDIAEALDASPAAVSGAIKYLEQTKLVRRMRPAGERLDRVVLGDDPWYTAMTTRSGIFTELNRALDTGIDALPRSGGAAKRLRETREFFAYIEAEMPKLIDRWHAERATD